MNGYVYAISNGRGAVKIGWSNDPERRLREMNTHDASSLNLVGYASGSKHHEREIHGMLRPARVRGEWFSSGHPHVSAFLAMLPNRERPVPAFQNDAYRGSKLEAFLSSRGLRPSAFALMAGVPPSTISRILRGERQPGVGVISKIIAASGGEISAADFFPPVDHPSEAAQ